jgi:hypothetical protein
LPFLRPHDSLVFGSRNTVRFSNMSDYSIIGGVATSAKNSQASELEVVRIAVRIGADFWKVAAKPNQIQVPDEISFRPHLPRLCQRA